MEREKLDQLIEKLGGKDRLVIVVQRRLAELAKGAEPQVQIPSRDLIEVALAEICEGKVDTSLPPEAAKPPEPVPFGRPPERPAEFTHRRRNGGLADRGGAGGGFRRAADRGKRGQGQRQQRRGGGGWRGPR